jgi:hypothetical protein
MFKGENGPTESHREDTENHGEFTVLKKNLCGSLWAIFKELICHFIV